jgi:hypothetical protein
LLNTLIIAFNCVVLDLARTEFNLEDEDGDFLVPISLPKSYKGLVVTPKYVKESIASSEVQTALLSYDQREDNF